MNLFRWWNALERIVALTKGGKRDWFGEILRNFFFFLSRLDANYRPDMSKIYRVFILERILFERKSSALSRVFFFFDAKFKFSLALFWDVF